MKVYEKISEIFDLLVQYLILLVELVGIIILIYAIVMAVKTESRPFKTCRGHCARS